ncbi:MAG: NAD(+) diphosphatase [Humibacillus sp.]
MSVTARASGPDDRPEPLDNRPEPLADLALSRTSVDRVGHEWAGDDSVDRLLADGATRVLEVRGDRVAVDAAPGGELQLRLRGPLESDRLGIGLHLGRGSDGTAYLGVIVTDPAPAPELEASADGPQWLTLRQTGEVLDARDAGLFTTALALANWHATHRHCPRCGAETEPTQAGWVRRCVSDGSEHYPRTDPAVIMSVIDPDDRLLLGRGAQWPEGRFSVLAGFVEPGESFESAVAREVLEEVGVVIDAVTYLGNQPWPFPASLMIGFAATTSQTELRPDPAEIAEARWVTREEYRELLSSGVIRTPSGISIAKRIIEQWLGATVESVAGAGVVDR